jgi:hypothetical protein
MATEGSALPEPADIPEETYQSPDLEADIDPGIPLEADVRLNRSVAHMTLKHLAK